jgi:putative ABC transport system permease protein
LDFREIFKLSFDVLEERKVRSALTIVMVMVRSSAGGGQQIWRWVYSILQSSTQQDQDSNRGPGIGEVVAPAPAKITLNTAVVNRLKSIPFIDEVILACQSQVELESAGS